MNISKLTFGQLYKLHHAATLMRVTAAYHGALERRWNLDPQASAYKFFVGKAKLFFPEVARPWEKLLRFLTGPELRSALRKAAGESWPRVMPSMWSDLLFCYHNDVGGFNAAMQRAYAIQMFTGRYGLPARVLHYRDHFRVQVQTDAIGAAIMLYHPGTFYSILKRWCVENGANCTKVFWWVPEDFDGLVNPCLKPIRTPDEGAQRREILQTAGA